mmetsp:Transcript_20917/g.59163  ORF Transcript_20917/g.59163 Transcript_20917/m.59163 type:complete len:234 (+) Transcript_20917:88-789(+)
MPHRQGCGGVVRRPELRRRAREPRGRDARGRADARGLLRSLRRGAGIGRPHLLRPQRPREHDRRPPGGLPADGRGVHRRGGRGQGLGRGPRVPLRLRDAARHHRRDVVGPRGAAGGCHQGRGGRHGLLRARAEHLGLRVRGAPDAAAEDDKRARRAGAGCRHRWRRGHAHRRAATRPPGMRRRRRAHAAARRPVPVARRGRRPAEGDPRQRGDGRRHQRVAGRVRPADGGGAI